MHKVGNRSSVFAPAELVSVVRVMEANNHPLHRDKLGGGMNGRGVSSAESPHHRDKLGGGGPLEMAH
jgi:hypothetical protein